MSWQLYYADRCSNSQLATGRRVSDGWRRCCTASRRFTSRLAWPLRAAWPYPAALAFVVGVMYGVIVAARSLLAGVVVGLVITFVIGLIIGTRYNDWPAGAKDLSLFVVLGIGLVVGFLHAGGRALKHPWVGPTWSSVAGFIWFVLCSIIYFPLPAMLNCSQAKVFLDCRLVAFRIALVAATGTVGLLWLTRWVRYSQGVPR
jgi:hypothetical protein